jgi:hypothetical protein
MIFRVVEELGLSRRFWEPKHGGSNPPHPTNFVSFLFDTKRYIIYGRERNYSIILFTG